MMTEVQARTVLWYLVFVGFAVNYMIRINLNITIVEMVAAKQKSWANVKRIHVNNSSMGEILSRSTKNISSQQISNMSTVSSVDIDKKFSLEKLFLESIDVPYDREGFHWNEYEQGLVLGSFFWAHWITQIPGGVLAKKYGTKLVFGLSNAIGCWMCFFIPIVSYFDYKALIYLRVIQGLITGLAWPAMHNLTGKWIPPNERGKFVTAYLGSSVGIAIFYPLFGYVISWMTWEWVYHICGIIGTTWWFGWLYFVYDTPGQHPRISETEIRYIEKSLGASVQAQNQNAPTPWKEILTSKPVWMNVVAQWGGIWGLFTLMTQAPTYFRVIHHWDIRATGILSGLPHLMRMLFAYVFSSFCDYLLRTEKMSRTNVRKLAATLCCTVKGFFVLALAYFGYNPTAAIVLITIATMFHGSVSSGPLAGIVDISPNYAGIVLGISGMIGVLPGFISPYIVGILTLGNQTIESWKKVFLITAGMLIGSGTLYFLFGDSSLQSWNNVTKSDYTDKEMHLLAKVPDDDLSSAHHPLKKKQNSNIADTD